MTQDDDLNPRLPLFLRLVTAVECLTVLSSALLSLILFLAKDYWPWIIPPFNARYVGAIYLSTLVPLLWMVIIGRWSPGKLVLWMIFVFTTAILLTMFFHFDRFEWGRFTTYIFWALYILLPINCAVHLVVYRKVISGAARPTHIVMALFLLAVGGGLLLYSLLLMVVPEWATAFWPWAVDVFHGRIYLAIFLAPAIGALGLVRRSAPADYVALGLLLLCFGLLAIGGVVVTNWSVPPDKQVNYAGLGTWVFFLLNLLLAVVGTILTGAGGLQWWLGRRVTVSR
jgi:hypothetical protein